MAVNLLTSTFRAATDGYNEIGFPFRFYAYTAGKCQECANFWHWPAFLLDAGCCLLAGWLALVAWRRLSS